MWNWVRGVNLMRPHLPTDANRQFSIYCNFLCRFNQLVAKCNVEKDTWCMQTFFLILAKKGFLTYTNLNKERCYGSSNLRSPVCKLKLFFIELDRWLIWPFVEWKRKRQMFKFKNKRKAYINIHIPFWLHLWIIFRRPLFSSKTK